jgi:hypothetical protein
MLRQLCELSDFARRIRAQMRFGDLSRASLQLLRVEIEADSAACEWFARPADPWDVGLPAAARERNISEQALRDAMQVRELLFSMLPDVQTANVRVYRQGEPPELIIAGTVKRDEPSLKGIRSLVMRVKLCGFKFHLDEGRLKTLSGDLT